MDAQILQFDDASNYRGCLEAKDEGGQCFWRVDCDVHEQQWEPIPRYLFDALKRYHDEKPN